MYHSHDGHINAEKCGNGEKKMISAFKMSANKIGKSGWNDVLRIRKNHNSKGEK